MDPELASTAPDLGSEEWFASVAESHGGVSKCAMVDTVIGPVVLRRPSRPETRFAVEQGLLDPAMKANLAAADKLSRQCVIYPAKESFSNSLDEYPLIPIVCLSALITLAGIGAKDSAGK